MGFDPAVRKKVRKLSLEKKAQLTPKEIFESCEFKNYLTSLASTMGNGAGETRTIIIEDTGPDGASYTDGSSMHINYGSKKIGWFDTPEGKFLGVMGTFFHEKSHDLFTDFNEMKRANSYLRDGMFYGETPKNMTAEEEADWTDMENALRAKQTREIFLYVYHALDNIISDRHDEDCLIDAYGSFAGESLLLGRQAKQSFLEFFESAERKVRRGEYPELAFMQTNVFQLAYFDDILARSQDAVERSDYREALEKIRTHAEIAKATDDVSRKYAELNWMMLVFWPYIRKAIADEAGNTPDSGDTGNGQTVNGMSTPQRNLTGGRDSEKQNSSEADGNAVQTVLNLMKSAAEGAGLTPAPEGHRSSDIAIAKRANERNGRVPSGKRASAEAAGRSMRDRGKQAVYHVLDAIRNDVAQKQAEAELEGEAESRLLGAVGAVSQCDGHSGIPVETTRITEVSPADIDRYERMMRCLRPVSLRLQRQMLELLRDQKEGYVRKHRQFGRLIVASDAYRPDQRYFADRKLPQDLPDMALSVLVDHSGSMSGERIESAMNAALLLHDFCTGLNIPVAVAGHNAVNGGGGVRYMIYADFEQIGAKDRYRTTKMGAALTKMQADHCNRDGLALNISEKLLAARREQVRLLIVISDGRPNHDGYGGEEAAKDIRGVLGRAKRDGIEVLACAIGDDKENIRAIYGDSYLDISDLTRLPKTLVGFVKKRILYEAV